MKAYDAKSTENLERTAVMLGNSPEVRTMVQSIYNLGLCDGQIKQLDSSIARLADHHDDTDHARTYPEAIESAPDGRILRPGK